jgi:cell division protein FtsZ
MMGTGEASGEKRAIEAAEAAISNPLLDDVSMRGARGLLISICGGPDLTLYEVDEAATRIREEVDPEANIILGATFDDSLEGTMRVSVVATGLSQEALAAAAPAEPEVMAPAAKGPVFGFTGKPQPVKKAVNPAPMAPMPQRPAPAPMVMEAEEDDEMAEAPRGAARIPSIEQFPPIAQAQVAAQQNRIANIADHAGKAQPKKKGLFERLASVGLGRKDDPIQQPQKEPSMTARAEPKMQPAAKVRAPAPAPAMEQGLDDDQLEIPAFLRRQAN